MADNYGFTEGSGKTGAANDIGGVLYQRVKVVWGTAGSATDASASNPLPTVQTGALPAGTNNIGDVDVLTLPALAAGTNNIGDVDVLTLPALAAGTNLIGKTAAGIDSSTIYNGTTEMTPKFNTTRAASSSGDTTIVAAVASKKIRVLNYLLSVGGAVNVKFKSATAGDISGLKYFDAAGAGAAAPYTPVGHFETTAGEALVINLSAAVAVGIDLTYVEV
jgi:hypothetical protein